MHSESSIRRRLVDTLEREDLTIEELVEEADTLLRELAPKQSRYRVTERPDARTVRYYVTQKLLPKPVSYAGGRARYSGRHLARLLMIKKLQAEHHTLQRIASVLETVSDEDVLRELFPSSKRRRPAPTKRVKPERLVAAASSESAEPETFQRRSLGHGASLDLPERLLKDRNLRAELADRLESLARSLRGSTHEEDEGDDS